MTLRLVKEGILRIQLIKPQKISSPRFRGPSKRWIKLYTQEESQFGDNSSKMLLEISRTNPRNTDLSIETSSSSNSRGLSPKIIPIIDVCEIVRSSRHPYRACLVLNRKGLRIVVAGDSHSETEEWLDLMRAPFWPLREPEQFAFSQSLNFLVSVLDSKSSHKLGLGGRYWLWVDLEGRNFGFILAHRTNIVQLLIPRAHVKYIKSVETNNLHDAGRIIELKFTRRSGNKKIDTKIWLFALEGRALLSSAEDFLGECDPLRSFHGRTPSHTPVFLTPSPIRSAENHRIRRTNSEETISSRVRPTKPDRTFLGILRNDSKGPTSKPPSRRELEKRETLRVVEESRSRLGSQTSGDESHEYRIPLDLPTDPDRTNKTAAPPLPPRSIPSSKNSKAGKKKQGEPKKSNSSNRGEDFSEGYALPPPVPRLSVAHDSIHLSNGSINRSQSSLVTYESIALNQSNSP